MKNKPLLYINNFNLIFFIRQEGRILQVFSTIKEAKIWIDQNIDNLLDGGLIKIETYKTKANINEIRKKLNLFN